MNGNAATWFVDRHVQEGRGDKNAFVEAWDDGRALTYAELAGKLGALRICIDPRWPSPGRAGSP